MTDRTRYIIEVQPAAGVDTRFALQRALKYLWRVCGLRCMGIREVDAEPGKATTAAPPGRTTDAPP
jgi:hypothetical protein